MSIGHVIIVEDEPALAGLIQDYLTSADMTSDVVSDGSEAVEQILQTSPDLVVLDVMLPNKDGLTICREVRAQSDVPIIMQTAKVEEIDRLLGLELGADDYLCKPYSPRELVARIKAILRRTRPTEKTDAASSSQMLVMDEARWSAAVKGNVLDLTRREFTILTILHQRPGRVFSRSQLLDMAFPDDTDVFDRTIDSHIKNLRRKIKDAAPGWDPIRSVYGVGYAYDG